MVLREYDKRLGVDIVSLNNIEERRSIRIDR